MDDKTILTVKGLDGKDSSTFTIEQVTEDKKDSYLRFHPNGRSAECLFADNPAVSAV